LINFLEIVRYLFSKFEAKGLNWALENFSLKKNKSPSGKLSFQEKNGISFREN